MSRLLAILFTALLPLATAAQSSATSVPIEWPTRLTRSIFAAPSSFTSQSAIAGTAVSGGPSERPWPGRSTASTFQPW